jgi:hypothetical protein
MSRKRMSFCTSILQTKIPVKPNLGESAQKLGFLQICTQGVSMPGGFLTDEQAADTSSALDASRLEQTLDIARTMNDANDFDAVLDRAVENQMSRKPLHPKHPGLGKKRLR